MAIRIRSAMVIASHCLLYVDIVPPFGAAQAERYQIPMPDQGCAVASCRQAWWLTLRHLANGKVKSPLAIDGCGFLFDNHIHREQNAGKIGRASCRERVCQYV